MGVKWRNRERRIDDRGALAIVKQVASILKRERFLYARWLWGRKNVKYHTSFSLSLFSEKPRH